MGVGKSSVARHLAQMLKCKRVDLDHMIEQSEGHVIAEIIDSVGEAAYRDIETANLKRAVESSDARILSLGGGTWTLERNRELLRSHGFTSVWLEATFDPTRLALAIAHEDDGLDADVRVLDVSGRTVRMLSQGALAPGLHDWAWDLRDAEGRRVAPGMYLVRAWTRTLDATHRLIVVR